MVLKHVMITPHPRVAKTVGTENKTQKQIISVQCGYATIEVCTGKQESTPKTTKCKWKMWQRQSIWVHFTLSEMGLKIWVEGHHNSIQLGG